MREAKNVTSYAAFASQAFLALSALWVMGLLYRWDSLRNAMHVWEIVIAFFAVLPVFGIVALVAGVPLLIVLVFLRVLHWPGGDFVVASARAVLIAVFAYGNFILLHFWTKNVSASVTGSQKIAALMVLGFVVVCFLIVHVLYKRRKFVVDDPTRRVAILIFLFAMLLSILALASIGIQNRITYQWKPVFDQYSFILLYLFFFSYWKECGQMCDRPRAAIVPAGILFLVASVVGIVMLFQQRADTMWTITPNGSMYPNLERVIVISFDGLAANRMSLYGNERRTTPNFDRFAKTSYVFDRAHANADETLLSLPSIHTGLRSYTARMQRYGAHLAGGDTVSFMPAVFRSIGWATAYLLFQPNEGIDDLFRRVLLYNDDAPARFLEEYYGNGVRRRMQKFALQYPLFPAFVVEAVYSDFRGTHQPTGRIEWSDWPGRAKFETAMEFLVDHPQRAFLWAHLWPPHHVYSRFKGFEGEFLNEATTAEALEQQIGWSGAPYAPEKQPIVDKLQLVYEEYVLATDAEFGRFLDALEANGLLERSMIVVTADHGEAFSRGELYHGSGLMYEQTMRIPLLIHMPSQREGYRVGELAQLVDIAPTILDALGVQTPVWMEGASLLPYMDAAKTGGASAPTRTTISQIIPGVTQLTDTDVLRNLYVFAVYRGPYKLIHRLFADYDLRAIPTEQSDSYFKLLQNYPSTELFNLSQDPEERVNLAEREPEVMRELMELVRQQTEKTKEWRTHL